MLGHMHVLWSAKTRLCIPQAGVDHAGHTCSLHIKDVEEFVIARALQTSSSRSGAFAALHKESLVAE
jgi:hypothetical protein